jgi:hypothetical protein
MFRQSYNSKKYRKGSNSGFFIIVLAIFIVVIGYFSAGSIFKFFGNISKSMNTKQNTSSAVIKVDENENTQNKFSNHIRGIYVPIANINTPEGLNSIIALSKRTEINAVVFDIKGEDGKLNYGSQIEAAISAGAISENKVDFKEINDKLKAAGIYSIARMVCFKDNFMPKANAAYSVQLSGGGRWWNAFYWLNPYSEDAKNYLYAIGEEAAALGFDELMLDEVKFPDNGRTELLGYGEISKTVTKADALNSFVNSIAAKVHQKNILLSLCTSAQVSLTDMSNNQSGQSFDFANLNVDYFSPRFSISSIASYSSNTNPIQAIQYAIEETNKKISSNSKLNLRPWVEDYNLSEEELKNIISKCKELKCGQYLSLNDKGVYKEGAYSKNG